MKNRLNLLIPLIILFSTVIGCQQSKTEPTNNIPTATPTKSLAISNQPTNQNTSTSAAQNFAPDTVCSLPKQVASNTPFADLGGGNWGKWSDAGGDLDFGCNGGKDSTKIKESDNGDITAEYGAVGSADIVHYVSAEYTAMEYTGLTPDEKKIRQQYVDFCDKLSMKFYGVKMPEKFKKRLLDESTYSPSGTANEYGEKVGNGYVNLSSNKNKNVMVMLDVHFFSSEAEYKKYKDS